MAYEADIARWLVEAAEMEAKEEESLPDGRNPKEVAEQKIEQCLRYDATHPGALAAWVGIYVKTGRGPLVMKRLNRIVRTILQHLSVVIAAFMHITGKLDWLCSIFKIYMKSHRKSKTDRSFEFSRTLRISKHCALRNCAS